MQKARGYHYEEVFLFRVAEIITVHFSRRSFAPTLRWETTSLRVAEIITVHFSRRSFAPTPRWGTTSLSYG